MQLAANGDEWIEARAERFILAAVDRPDALSMERNARCDNH